MRATYIFILSQTQTPALLLSTGMQSNFGELQVEPQPSAGPSTTNIEKSTARLDKVFDFQIVVFQVCF